MYNYNLMIVHFYIRGWIYYDARHSFFVSMRTGSYLPDSNEYEKYINCKDAQRWGLGEGKVWLPTHQQIWRCYKLRNILHSNPPQLLSLSILFWKGYTFSQNQETFLKIIKKNKTRFSCCQTLKSCLDNIPQINLCFG